MKKLENVSYGLHPDQIMDIYLPDTADFTTFVYFHGGGFEITGATKTKGEFMAAYLADHGIAVICVEYRKYPEAAYPDFIRDCAAATAWARWRSSPSIAWHSVLSPRPSVPSAAKRACAARSRYSPMRTWR